MRAEPAQRMDAAFPVDEYERFSTDYDKARLPGRNVLRPGDSFKRHLLFEFRGQEAPHVRRSARSAAAEVS